jgi:putative DNA primase/helicase
MSAGDGGRLTIFADVKAYRKVEQSLDIARLLATIRTTTAPAKTKLPLIKLASFGDKKTEKGSLRHDANMISISGLEADYDAARISFEDACAKVRDAGLSALLYTSPSHTEDAPRWRVICPFSQEYPTSRRDEFMGRLSGLFNGNFSLESWAHSQSYYIGSVKNNPSHRAEIIDGTPIDLLESLDATWIGRPALTVGSEEEQGKVRPVSSGGYSPLSEKRFEAYRNVILAKLQREAVDGQKHRRLIAIARTLGGIQAEARFTDETAVQWLMDALPDSVADWVQAKSTARWGLAKGREKPFQLEDRPNPNPKANGYANGHANGIDHATKDCAEPPQTDAKDDDPIVLSPSAPMVSARSFIERHHTDTNLRSIHHQNDTFYAWRQTHYAETPREDIRAQIYGFLDKAARPAGKGKTTPFEPTRSKVANVLEATAAVAQVSRDIFPPAWLDAQPHPPAADLIACTNGLLHITTRDMLDHTPAFFSLNALGFDYQADTPRPRQWIDFLAELWPDDQPAIDTLQEMFGLMLTGDTRHQKAFLIVGPKRSGKGTIARVLIKLLGQDNVSGPTLSSMSTNFGLAPLIGKRLAVISDARLGSRADQSIIVERILSITGEDTLTVDRKNRDAWTGRLEVRFIVLTNELPRLTDSSGALASRFIILTLTQSFIGREDHALTDRLAGEMPGILNWSLGGLERLRQRGHFVPPASSDAARQALEDLGSPISAFLRECCDVGQSAWNFIATNHLFDAWCKWCRDNNQDHPGTVQMFGSDLRTVIPNLKVRNQRNDDGSDSRTRHYVGISLKDGI